MRARPRSESDVSRYQDRASNGNDGLYTETQRSPDDRDGSTRVSAVERLRGRVSPRSDGFGGGGHRGGLRRGRSPEQRENTRREPIKVSRAAL